MKKVSILILFACATLSVAAQDAPRFALKLYNNMYYSNTSLSNGEKMWFTDWINPSLALQMRHKNPHFSSELELVRAKKYSTIYNELYYTSSSTFNYLTYQKKGIDLAVRYTFNYEFFKEQHKIMPSIGIAFMPSFDQAHFYPISSTTVSHLTPFKISTFHLSSTIIPRLTYNITPRWFIEASVPIEVSRFKVQSYTTYEATKQRTTQSNHQFFPTGAITPRIGLGFRLK